MIGPDDTQAFWEAWDWAVCVAQRCLVLLAVLAALDVAFPEPDPRLTFDCPKVEYRVTVRRGVAVRDTVTRIPKECQ